ncbi:MAG: hypothetical protein Q8909_18085 [Bacteroidota bacterium]|nr:hypothetical protein [Bacteroidota bacterium]
MIKMLLTRIPKDIPVTAALAGGFGLMAFGFTALFLDPRPSSTAGLGLLFIPIWSLVAGACGYALGLVIRALWNRLAPNSTFSRAQRWVLPGLLVLVVSGASLFGWWEVLKVEVKAKPAVIIDTGKLERQFVPNSDTFVRSSIELYQYDRSPPPISWGQNNSEVAIERSAVRIRDTGMPNREVVISTSALDYVMRIHAAPLYTKAESEPLLAVLICGRATGRSAIVLVIAPDYSTILEERLYRFWQLDRTALEIRKERLTGSENIVIGSGCEKSLVIRHKTDYSINPERTHTSAFH